MDISVFEIIHFYRLESKFFLQIVIVYLPSCLSDLFSLEPEEEDSEVESETNHRDQDKVDRAGQEHLKDDTDLGKLEIFACETGF